MTATTNPDSHADPRTLLFVSHANPEDNDFARWLSLQLTNCGYQVWSDVTRLIGGEDFWRDIETAIRRHTAKFLFVLSKDSNTKQGPLNELSVARATASRLALPDFILPLKTDDLPFEEMNIELARLNAVSFKPNWAQGLSLLLKKLEEDRVPKSPEHSSRTVATWWREHYSPSEGVTAETEEYLSNWFPINSLPPTIYFHEVGRSGSGSTLPTRRMHFPFVPYNNFLISFAGEDAVRDSLPDTYGLRRSLEYSTSDMLSYEAETPAVALRERRHMITDLLRQCWATFVREEGTLTYELANKRECAFLKHEGGVSTRIVFRGPGDTQGVRALTGYRTVFGRKRFWHFAISARPLLHPFLVFAVYPHVVFSDDGRVPWEEKKRMHKARRSQCKDWWNDVWRDRILAFLAVLADGQEALALDTGGPESIVVSVNPVRFVSPVSYEPSSGTGSIYEEAAYEDDLREDGEYEEDEDDKAGEDSKEEA